MTKYVLHSDHIVCTPANGIDSVRSKLKDFMKLNPECHVVIRKSYGPEYFIYQTT